MSRDLWGWCFIHYSNNTLTLNTRTSAANGCNKTAFIQEQCLLQQTHRFNFKQIMITAKAAIPTVIKLQYKQRQLLFLWYILDVIFLAFYVKTKTLRAKKNVYPTSVNVKDLMADLKATFFFSFFFFTIRRMGAWAQCSEAPELYRFAVLVYYLFIKTWGYSDLPIKLTSMFLSVGGNRTGRKTHAAAIEHSR